MSSKGVKSILFALALAILSGGCSPMVKDGQPAITKVTELLDANHSLGQTFVARDGGLDGIEIFLAPVAPGAGTLSLHLRNDPTASADIATSSLPLRQAIGPAFYRFNFTPREDSYKHDYYFLLEVNGGGSVSVGIAPGDAFLDGAMYRNGEPVDEQTAFRLAYDPFWVALNLLEQGVLWLYMIAVAVMLFVLPGLALLTLLWRASKKLAWGEQLGLAIGISLALYPLLLLWTHLVGLQLGALHAWVTALASFLFLVWRNRNWRPTSLKSDLAGWRRSSSYLPDLSFVAVILLILLTRFWVIRSLDVPMWGDSYQHTMITQLIVDHGGLFDSWQPYADIQSFTYHFGFHIAAAVVAWVSGLPVATAVLWSAQILNALAVFALYPLSMRVAGNRWAGVAAVLIAGLLAQMPMFYVNWGRYTQLAGQVILPGVICILWAALEKKDRDWRLIALTWLVLGGLALTHYRVLIFAILFIPAFFLTQLHRARVLIARIFLLGVGAGLLFLPWFMHMFAGKIATAFAIRMTTPASATTVAVQEYNAIGEVVTYLPLWLWLIALASLLLGLWRRERRVALMVIWSSLILLAANPQWLRLPGEGAISNFAIFIAAYMPVAVVVGSALAWLTTDWQWIRGRVVAALVAVIVALGLLGARERIGDLQISQHALVTRPDLRAASWIRENTPADARFLVNSFFAYGGSVIVGSDGGWWLPLIAQRQTTLPPINYSSEKEPRADYREWINALTDAIQSSGVASPSVLAMLRERGLTHVYIGQEQGRVNYAGPYVLEPEKMLASSHFHPIYHQDRVWVFEVVQ
jgi:uncharacterized protein DUF6541